MTRPVLHHVAAARSFRVLWMLCELGEEPEVRHYAIPDGSLRQPDFLDRWPAGRVPALEIDGRVLFESGAILEYLAETRGRLGRAPGDPERANYLQWMHFAETQAVHLQMLNLSHVFLRDPAQRSPTIQKLEAKRLEVTLRVTERALQERDWLLPGGFSAADMMQGFNLLAAPRYVRFDAFPALQSYVARFEGREGYRRARALDGVQQFYDRDFYEWDR